MRRLDSILIGILLSIPNTTAAQGIISGAISDCDFISGELSAECVPKLLSYIISFIFSLIGGVTIIMIIVAGYQIALAKATGRDRSEGLTRLRVAIIGFVLCAFSWYMIDFIISSLAGI
jgi:hypothetical protein